MKSKTKTIIWIIIGILVIIVVAGIAGNNAPTNSANNTQNDTNSEQENEQASNMNYHEKFVGSWVQAVSGMDDSDYQGFQLLEDGSARSINMASELYKRWWLEDENIVFEIVSLGNESSTTYTIEYSVVEIDDRTLILQNGETVLTYTKTDTPCGSGTSANDNDCIFEAPDTYPNNQLVN